MQEGIAQICLITSNMTIVRAKIDQVIPRKRKGNVSQHEKVCEKMLLVLKHKSIKTYFIWIRNSIRNIKSK